jgi:uncharacterized glyoxalase superfamily protein PhnB
MEITPYLRFEAQCEEAMKEYQRILGGDLQFMVSFSSSSYLALYTITRLPCLILLVV